MQHAAWREAGESQPVPVVPALPAVAASSTSGSPAMRLSYCLGSSPVVLGFGQVHEDLPSANPFLFSNVLSWL